MEKLKSGSEVTDSEGDWLSNDKMGSLDTDTTELWKNGPAQTTYLYIQMEYCPR